MSRSRKDNLISSDPTDTTSRTTTYAPRIVVTENHAALGRQLFQEILQDAPRGPHTTVSPTLEIRSGIEVSRLLSSSSSSQADAKPVTGRYETFAHPSVQNVTTTVTPRPSVTHHPSKEYAHLNVGGMRLTVTESPSASSQPAPARSRRPNNTIVYAPTVTHIGQSYNVVSTSEYVGQTINLDDLLDADSETPSSAVVAQQSAPSNDIIDMTVTVTPETTATGYTETPEEVIFNPSFTVRSDHMEEDLAKVRAATRNVPDPRNHPGKSVHITPSIIYTSPSRKLSVAEMLSKMGALKAPNTTSSSSTASTNDSVTAPRP
jgi:hypothetical protein